MLRCPRSLKGRIGGAASQILRSGKVLELGYDGWSQCVEIHAVGYSREGNPLMPVWQVSAGSNSNEPRGWKPMRCAEAFTAHMSAEASQGQGLAIRTLTEH